MAMKTQARMSCWNCPRYQRSELRCLDGKANPKNKADTVAVAEMLGLRALCHYNLYRDALALRLHFPGTKQAIASVAPRRKRRGPTGPSQPGEDPSSAETQTEQAEATQS